MKPDISLAPDLPGVYLMKDESDNIIYIGKAISLKKRVSQYFQSGKHHSPKTRSMVSRIADIEYIVTASEVDALVLEANLVRKNRPKYNVTLKDDKRYPYIKVTINSKYPRIFLTRKRLMDKALYFGPYTNVTPMRKSLDMINQLFRIRTCRKRIDGRRKRPCLNYHIQRCSAPCTGNISEEEYRSNILKAVDFLKGNTSGIIDMLQHKMEACAAELDFEKAAQLRDQIEAVKEFTAQRSTTSGNDDSDIIAAVATEDNIYVQTFFVRDGNMVGKADFTLSGGSPSDNGSDDIAPVLGEFIKQYYQDAPIPPEIILQQMVPDRQLITKWLSKKASRPVQLVTPRRGTKKQLLEMAAKNAEMTMHQAQLKGLDTDNAFAATEKLKEVLSLEKRPARIEGFDISNISGTNAVGSLVTFDNGMPAKDRYRHFNIKTVKGIDDFSMMAEVVGRRYKKLKENKEKFPDLILIDGGPGQVNAAHNAISQLGLDIPLIGLAKRFEHIITPKDGDGQVIILPHTDPALKLLMQVRDESHRFAVSSHRARRNADLSHSELDTIPGVGSTRKKALFETFGSIEKIRKASEEDISEVKGISKKLARAISDHLNRDRV